MKSKILLNTSLVIHVGNTITSEIPKCIAIYKHIKEEMKKNFNELKNQKLFQTIILDIIE